ncbi:hypothetical protein [Fusibacter ferrireducens]|uniref:Uncharacterized protein n=1 Tax=Fusibacter ferrireducens TaxID=2785058 RepID=A0ABR9ZNX7_9FIRM|nr:hypothetical protein [Fusibacter ferrireducens]MBF4692173.1 hypothetical protein [Fusibacter ferrireducens]
MNGMKIIIGLLILVVVILVSLKAYLFPRFSLPAVKGHFKIGEINLQLEDLDRAELYTPETSDYRKVMVSIWYPMQEAIGKPKQYPEAVKLKEHCATSAQVVFVISFA